MFQVHSTGFYSILVQENPWEFFNLLDRCSGGYLPGFVKVLVTKMHLLACHRAQELVEKLEHILSEGSSWCWNAWVSVETYHLQELVKQTSYQPADLLQTIVLHQYLNEWFKWNYTALNTPSISQSIFHRLFIVMGCWIRVLIYLRQVLAERNPSATFTVNHCRGLIFDVIVWGIGIYNYTPINQHVAPALKRKIIFQTFPKHPATQKNTATKTAFFPVAVRPS